MKCLHVRTYIHIHRRVILEVQIGCFLFEIDLWYMYFSVHAICVIPVIRASLSVMIICFSDICFMEFATNLNNVPFAKLPSYLSNSCLAGRRQPYLQDDQMEFFRSCKISSTKNITCNSAVRWWAHKLQNTCTLK